MSEELLELAGRAATLETDVLKLDANGPDESSRLALVRAWKGLQRAAVILRNLREADCVF